MMANGVCSGFAVPGLWYLSQVRNLFSLSTLRCANGG